MNSTTSHRLLVMRHAKSSWATPEPDHERPLNKRGIRDGFAAGQWLAEQIGDIDHVLCSTAARTRLTWERVEDGGARATGISYHEQMYESPVSSFRELITALPESAGTVLFLGHWPGVQDLVREVATRDNHPGWASMDLKFPTSAIAVLEFEGTWEKLQPGDAQLREYVVPRG
ncbi:phosphohistidine phosphatase [Corynebacterium occultum]|uniref:Phosphohistidine phosphatase n=1 Tax=Corynebacterium occultum TaxID=2675219 RepID=A0A6B8W7H2_9CORY|nr:histidine phosphatase family protein [Corynebacterium occultum]QGU07867.1 phosphohistidine phosphatase [Corynebacterium occultum]